MNARSLKSELLKLFPVFAEMPAAEADRILSAASIRTVKAGTALFCAGNPPFRRYVFALFSERLSGMMELVEAVSFQHMDQRLVGLLLERGEVVHGSQQKLADDLGTVREMVGRVLRNFEDRGLVALGREQIRILDPEGLQAILDGRP